MARSDWPLPRFPEPDTEPFWRATKAHELRYQVCGACGATVFYPRGHCNTCLSRHLSWHTSSGCGVIYSHTTVHRSRQPGLEDHVPYTILLVDMDEHFRLLSIMLDARDRDRIAIGARVAVAWEDFDEVALPAFRLESDPA